MADVSVTCENCGARLTISEFVDREKATCAACFKPLALPKAAAGAQESSRKQSSKAVGWRVKRREASTADDLKHTGIAVEQAGSKERRRQKAAREKSAGKTRSQNTLVAWVLFLLIGMSTAAMRYGGIVDPAYFDLLQEYGIFVLLVFYVLVVVRAFEDAAFNGILCLMMPPYSLYYLYANSDDFMLRAIFAGTMAGLGQDCLVSLSAYTKVMFDAVNSWILTGGGGGY